MVSSRDSPEDADFSGKFDRTSTPIEGTHTEFTNGVHNITELDKSASDSHIKNGLDTEIKTHQSINHDTDVSFDASFQNDKHHKDETTSANTSIASPSKYKLGGSLYGRASRDSIKPFGAGGVRTYTHVDGPYSRDKRLSVDTVTDDRPESRQSSISGISQSQLVSVWSKELEYSKLLDFVFSIVFLV